MEMTNEKVIAILSALKKCYLGEVVDTLDFAIEAVKARESHKKGYWINPTSLDCCCSECGGQPECEPGSSIPLYDYCPYCGAEMAVKWE